MEEVLDVSMNHGALKSMLEYVMLWEWYYGAVIVHIYLPTHSHSHTHTHHTHARTHIHRCMSIAKYERNAWLAILVC